MNTEIESLQSRIDQINQLKKTIEDLESEFLDAEKTLIAARKRLSELEKERDD